MSPESLSKLVVSCIPTLSFFAATSSIAVAAADTSAYPYFSFYGGIAIADVKTTLFITDNTAGTLAEAPVITFLRDGSTFKICQQRRVIPGPTTLDTQAIPTFPVLPAGSYRIEYASSDTAGSGALDPRAGTIERDFVVYDSVLPGVPPSMTVEYYSKSLNHYFITADLNEMYVLDTSQIPGWTRTGQSWTSFATAYEPSDNLVPVCRFYGVPTAGINSHFYSADSSDCQYVIDHWPDQWLLETLNAVMVIPTSPSNSCPLGTKPAWRLYNNAENNNPNHRYTISRDIVAQMEQQGWVLEKAAWCVFGTPSSTPGRS